MGVWAVLCTVIELLDDDDLLARLAALKEDSDLRRASDSVRVQMPIIITFPGL